MKQVERILILGIIFVLMVVGVSASAEALDVQDVRLSDGNVLSVLLYGPTNRGVGAYSATLDEKPLVVNSLDANSEGTTWIFLVDTSTVSINRGTEPVKALLGLGDHKGLIDGIGPNDNAALIATGDISGNYDLSTRVSNLEMLATKFTEAPDRTMLNATIAAALNFLNTNSGVKRHKVLVIISNGETDNESGMGSRELQDLASSSGVTIYTVAFVRDNADWNAITQFGGLADNSCGGLKFTPASTAQASEAASIVSQIATNEKRFFNLRLNAGNVTGAQLKVAVDDGNQHLEDTIVLPENVQSTLQSMVPTEPIEIIPEPEPEDRTLFGLSMPVAIGIAAGLVAILVLVVVLLAHRKKQKQKPRKDAPIPGDVTVPDDPVSRESANPNIQVTLSQIGSNSEACYIAEMHGNELVVGRDPTCARLVIPNDPKISRKHLTLCFEDGTMSVKDWSRNGTKVNDRKINQPTVLHQQDTLTIGLTKLRITWWVKR